MNSQVQQEVMIPAFCHNHKQKLEMLTPLLILQGAEHNINDFFRGLNSEQH